MPVETMKDAYLGQRAGVAVLDYVKRFHVLPADVDASSHKAFIPLEAGELVLSVRAHVLSTLTGASTLDIGDSGDSDGWIDSSNTDCAPTAGAFANSLGLANGYSKGKVYTTAAALEVLFDAKPSAGELVVEVLFGGFDPGFARGVINSAYLS